MIAIFTHSFFKRANISLQGKLISGGVVLLLVPLFVSSIFSMLQTSSSVKELSWQQMDNLAADLSGMVNIIIKENVNIANALASGNTIVKAAQSVHENGLSGSEEKLQKLVAKLDEKYERIGQNFWAFVVTDGNGKVIGATSNGQLDGLDLGKYDFLRPLLPKKSSLIRFIIYLNCRGRLCPLAFPLSAKRTIRPLSVPL